MADERRVNFKYTDLELTSMVRGIADGPACDCALVIQPKVGVVIVQAYPSSCYVIPFTVNVKKEITKALLEWLPDLEKVIFDPHR